MIYDEGFEIKINDLEFFFFNKYFQKNGQFLSNCAETLIGWIYNKKTKERGCAYASQFDN